MIDFFQNYIGYSGLFVVAGIVIAVLSSRMDKNAGVEASLGSTVGIVLGIIIAILGALMWLVVWKLEQM